MIAVGRTVPVHSGELGWGEVRIGVMNFRILDRRGAQHGAASGRGECQNHVVVMIVVVIVEHGNGIDGLSGRSETSTFPRPTDN